MLWHVPPSCSTGTSRVFTSCPGVVGLALSRWANVMSLEVLNPVSVKPRGLIAASAEALNTSSVSRFCAGHPCPFLSSSQGVWENKACGQGLELLLGLMWPRARCGPVGAASHDFISLTLVFLNVRGRKTSCGESRGGCFQQSCCPFEGALREEETCVALSPTQTHLA